MKRPEGLGVWFETYYSYIQDK